jgi:hypothetical protein
VVAAARCSDARAEHCTNTCARGTAASRAPATRNAARTRNK